MSIVKESRRGTIAMGKRQQPRSFDPDFRQLDHPVFISLMNTYGYVPFRAAGRFVTIIRHLEAEAEVSCRAYLASMVNPDLQGMERQVVAALKEFCGDALQIRWANQLPPTIQKVINTNWQTRREPVPQVATGRLLGMTTIWA